MTLLQRALALEERPPNGFVPQGKYFTNGFMKHLNNILEMSREAYFCSC